MDPIPLALGAALGLGILLAFRGFRILGDRARQPAARRQGYWWLNGGLALIACSALVFTMMARG